MFNLFLYVPIYPNKFLYNIFCKVLNCVKCTKIFVTSSFLLNKYVFILFYYEYHAH